MEPSLDLSFQQDLASVVKGLPPPIRELFTNGKVGPIAKLILEKNKLHIDQGAIVEREIILLLLGINDPDTFTKALAHEARLERGTINAIIDEINQKIFMPLQQQMREGGAPKPAGQASVPSYKPPPPMPQAQAPRPIQQPPPIPRPMPPPPANLPGAMPGEKMLSDHEVAHIEIGSREQVVVSSQMQRPATPFTMPVAPTNSQITPPAPQPMPRAFTNPPPLRPSVAPSVGGPPPMKPIATYSTDPYREPFDKS